MVPFLRRQRTHRRIEALIRQGVGVREATWPMPARNDEPARAALAGELLGWVRASLGEMRRPYGINQVALALAGRDLGGAVFCANSLGVVRPSSFYSSEGPDGILAFLDDLDGVRGDGEVRIAAALLSLGDLAYELEAA